MESPIDEKYRLQILGSCVKNVQSVPYQGHTKHTFTCPFCGYLGKTESKRNERKAVLLWNTTQHSWVFSCARKGSPTCFGGMTFPNFLNALAPSLFRAYQQEREHSGTTGRGHNCPAVPKGRWNQQAAGNKMGTPPFRRHDRQQVSTSMLEGSGDASTAHARLDRGGQLGHSRGV